MNPLRLHLILMLNTMNILMRKIINLKLVIVLGFQNTKAFCQRIIQNWSEDIFVVTKIKNTVPWTYMISDLNGEAITGTFYEK